uniref:lytic cellulose monooxygenase (C4-dehydrogenating) n=1 Tax=Bionectria ochroleuca TaxID=29856 RepID=A0A8H7NQ75_BIOOC
MLRLAVASAFSSLLAVVNAHGGAMHYIIDGEVYTGNWDIQNNTEGSIQRQWNWGGVSKMEDPYLACGNNGVPHANSYYAPIVAGNIVTANYSLDTKSEEAERPWTFGHPYGAMLAYMAACPEEGCESVDLNAPIWFKVWEAGLISGTWVDGYWAMKDVYEGAELDISTPASLKPGKYILRHEMLNLQTGPAQWFPQCIQLEVSGSGDSLPSTEDLVAFPGAYDKDLEKSFTIKGAAHGFTSLTVKTQSIRCLDQQFGKND